MQRPVKQNFTYSVKYFIGRNPRTPGQLGWPTNIIDLGVLPTLEKAAQDSRRISRVGSCIVTGWAFGLAIRSRRVSANCFPSSSVNTCTDVSGGLSAEASGVSLKPATLRS